MTKSPRHNFDKESMWIRITLAIGCPVAVAGCLMIIWFGTSWNFGLYAILAGMVFLVLVLGLTEIASKVSGLKPRESLRDRK